MTGAPIFSPAPVSRPGPAEDHLCQAKCDRLFATFGYRRPRNAPCHNLDPASARSPRELYAARVHLNRGPKIASEFSSTRVRRVHRRSCLSRLVAEHTPGGGGGGVENSILRFSALSSVREERKMREIGDPRSTAATPGYSEGTPRFVCHVRADEANIFSFPSSPVNFHSSSRFFVSLRPFPPQPQFFSAGMNRFRILCTSGGPVHHGPWNNCLFFLLFPAPGRGVGFEPFGIRWTKKT